MKEISTETRLQIISAFEKAWVKFPHAKNITLFAMCNIIADTLSREGVLLLYSDIRSVLEDETKHGRIFFIHRGRNAGYYRTEAFMKEAQEKKKETILPPPAIPNLGGDLNALMHGLAIGYGLLPVEPPSAGAFKECLPGYLDKHKATEAINDHVCPSCGNDRVSKTEKSCWKCGSSL